MIKVPHTATRRLAALRAEYTEAARCDRRATIPVLTGIDPDVAWSYLRVPGARVEIHDDAVRLYPLTHRATLWYEFTRPGADTPTVTKSHAQCAHPSTKVARARCRRQNAV